MEEEIQQLSHVEEIEMQLAKAVQILDEEYLGARSPNEVKAGLNKIDALGEQYAQLNELAGIRIELNDLSTELARALEQLEAIPPA